MFFLIYYYYSALLLYKIYILDDYKVCHKYSQYLIENVIFFVQDRFYPIWEHLCHQHNVPHPLYIGRGSRKTVLYKRIRFVMCYGMLKWSLPIYSHLCLHIRWQLSRKRIYIGSFISSWKVFRSSPDIYNSVKRWFSIDLDIQWIWILEGDF